MRSIANVVRILLFCAVFSVFPTSAQTKTGSNSSRQADEYVYQSVEQMPRFPGGDAELMKYIQAHLQYPAVEDNITGRVTVQFIVQKDGSIGKVKVVRSLAPEFDQEAIRVVKSLPNFIPGKQKGEPVNVWYTLPINFKLQQ